MITSGLISYDYFKMLKYVIRLQHDFPFISVSSIGKSVMGKDITSLKIGQAEEYVLFMGGIHGSEHYSSGFLLNFFHDLCKAVADNKSIEGLNARRALSGRALIIVPSVNPDGCEIASKGKVGCGNAESIISKKAEGSYKKYNLNARGVDIDLDFSASHPSEPETSSVISLLKDTPIRHCLLLGFGDGKIIKTESEKLPARSRRMSEIMAASSKLELSFDKGENRADGFVRWFSESFHKPSFKVLPNLSATDEEALSAAYKEIRELLMLTAIM